jgi:hypothetical protein
VLAALACVAFGACGSSRSDFTTDDPSTLPGSKDGGGGGMSFLPDGAATPTCSDGVKNGTESDVDCGGSCAPCADGKHCGAAAECTTGQCTGGTCCSTHTYDKTTGPVAGLTTLCCENGDDLLTYSDCGTGSSHAVFPAGNCAFASEGGDNGGNACAAITCQASTCSKSCQGTGYTKSTGPVAGQVCCNTGDVLAKSVDCGNGNNHTITTSGTCATSSEGSGNQGSPCALIFCSTKPCPTVPDAGVPQPK